MDCAFHSGTQTVGQGDSSGRGAYKEPVGEKPGRSTIPFDRPMPTFKWKPLLALTVMILIACPAISQAYFISLYDDRTILTGEVEGKYDFKGNNTMHLKWMDEVWGTNWIARIDGVNKIKYQDEDHGSYIPREALCSYSIISPSNQGEAGSIFFGGNFALSGNITFNELVSDGTGYHIDYFTLKGVTGTLSGISDQSVRFERGAVDIQANRQLITFTGVNNYGVELNTSGRLYFNVTISDGILGVSKYSLQWKPLDGQLTLTSFSGTAVQDGNIYFGDVTVKGTGITNKTQALAYEGDPEDPPRYWKMEIGFDSGHISGNYLPYWGFGMIIGAVVVLVLLASAALIWKIRRNTWRIEKERYG